jgi:hypothetical protein
MKKKYVQTFEDFIGAQSKRVQHKDIHGKDIISGSANDPKKHYDQEDDGSDSLTGSTLNF